MGCPKNAENSELYQRLTKWPMIISFGLAATMWLCYAVVYYLLFPSLLGGFFFGLTLRLSIAAAGSIRIYFAHYLGRQRVWRWLHTKFSSWDELGEWIKNTHARKLEDLVQLPIDSWEPDIKNGGSK